MKSSIIVLIIAVPFLFGKCKKNNTPECAIPAIVPFQPYFNPVWQPNGQLLGFNHTPLSGVFESGTPPCTWYMNAVKQDSAGFYLMNKDGTGFKRVTKFTLSAPSWSPDGKWLAFSSGPNIYKMPFNGSTFDTTQIIQLTTSGGNFYPSWTANSDTIYFDSNIGTNGAGYYVWKMASDGSGKTGIPNTGRKPVVGSDNRIYYVGLQGEIYSMYKDGTNQIQITYNQKNGSRRSPKYYESKLFFWDGAIFSTPVNQYLPEEICKGIETYDISNTGEIVYATFEYSITDRRNGTLWIINADGSNKRQITYNHY